MTFISGGELVVKALRKNSVEKVFGQVGNHVSPIFVNGKKYGIDIIDVRHEQAAVHMADGWSQATRNVGVAIVVGGPGFTNAITGIVKAYFASTPLIVIIGGTIPEHKDSGGLQDMDQLGVIRNCTKWAATVYDTKRIPEYIHQAFVKATSGKMGPVVLEIPINILKNEVNNIELHWPQKVKYFQQSGLSDECIDEIIELISHSKQPIIIAGDEVYYSRAEQELIEFVEASGIPVFTVNKARGCIPDSHSLCFGNGRVLEAGPQLYALKNADLVINIGLYIDYQMGSGKAPFFSDNQIFINITRDIDYNSKVTHKRGIVASADSKQVLLQLIKKVKNNITFDFQLWINNLIENENEFFNNLNNNQNVRTDTVHPLEAIREIQRKIEDAIIVLDGSNALFWGGLLFACQYPGQLIIGPDGTHGPMGSGIPLAIAAKLAYPDKTVVLYTGDGSFGYNAIEMDTAVRLNIPITVIVHNDKSWGFCKSTQEEIYGKGAAIATEIGIRRYDKVVEALGGYGMLVETIDQISEALKNAIDSRLPSCINIMVDENAWAPGAIMFNESLKAMK